MNTRSAAWMLILALGASLGGCGGDDDDSSTVIVDPGPAPGPGPSPTPDPDPGPGPGPQPDPEPTPDPDPGPLPDPDPEPEPEPEAPPPPTGWFEQSDQFNHLFDVVFALDADHVWAATRHVVRTQDGGQTWEQVGSSAHSGISKFWRLQFLDPDVGWGMTLYSIQSTNDGGETWQVVRALPGETWYLDLFFLSATTGWVASETGLLKTTDSGQTWSEVTVQEPYGSGEFQAVRFVDAQRGWITVEANGASHILGTVDGGATWQHQLSYEGDSVHLRKIIAVDATHAWIASTIGPRYASPVILKTTDGSTWSSLSVEDLDPPFYDVTFVNSQVGWATGHYMHRTDDGGATWTLQQTPRLYMSGVDFIDENTGWAVGGEGAILKTTTGGVQ